MSREDETVQNPELTKFSANNKKWERMKEGEEVAIRGEGRTGRKEGRNEEVKKQGDKQAKKKH